ncbi:MAG: acetylornithine deacetylase [Rhodobacteraceae bacterium]|nr:acetylornithine deacetylase [Paracoccaceae bacterium]
MAPSAATTRLLSDLVAFDTTSRNSNLALIHYVRDYLAGFGVHLALVHDATGRKANLWATIGGEGDGGLVVSGHTDCVPVDGEVWTSDPFVVTERDGRLFGRGTADMKGFLACVLAAVPEMVARPLSCPIHLAFSHDEEIGCVGVRSLLDELSRSGPRPAMCLVGEPTSMQVVTGHKGGRAYRCRVTGLSAHSSLAPQAVNAIEFAAEIIAFIRGLARDLAAGPRDEAFDLPHSTVSTGLIEGGAAINIVPANCTFVYEFRNLIEVDQAAIQARVETFARNVLLPEMRGLHPGADIVFEPIYEYPAHSIDAGDPFVTLMKRMVGRNDHAKVAYGAEAGLFRRELGIATVLCGPGQIAVAHKPDEWVGTDQLVCERLLAAIVDHLRAV